MSTPENEVGTWHAALDKNSGRTYYYNKLTKKTTWDKPYSLQTPEERRAAAEELASRINFFKAMEANMEKTLRGDYVRTRRDSEDLMEKEMLIDDGILPRSGMSSPRQRFDSQDSTGSGGAFARSLRRRQNSSDSMGSTGSMSGPSSMRTRTISTIDSEMIEYLRKNAVSADVRSQSKDDGSGNHMRTFSGSWSNDPAAGLLDPGAEAKDSRRSAREDKRSSPGTPRRGKDDFDFLKEFDYLKIGGMSRDQNSPKDPPKIDSNSPRAITSQMSQPKTLQRRNSTSTIFVNSTMGTQDNDATIKCISVVMRAHMRSSHRRMNLPDSKYDVFLDAAYRDERALSERVESKGSWNGNGNDSPSDRLYGDTSHPVMQSKEVFGESPRDPGLHAGRRTMLIPSLDEIESFFTVHYH
jgi:hypothetical protein